MDRLIHTSLSALRGAMHRQTAVAHNLANANTTGFRREITSARALWIRGEGFDARAQSSQEVLAADMSAGTVNQTGRDLDVAMQGDALLAVQPAAGGEAYTRRGDLMTSPSGVLTTGDGHVVLGEQGPVTIPPADSVRIDQDGTIWIVPTGGDPNQPVQVDRLKLASPAGSEIRKGLDGLFRVPDGGVLPSDPQARLTPRSLEGSNVEVTQGLMDMIEASRAWETQLRLITTARDIDTSAADLMRLPG
ncbi:flagellar basal body rod protein FlgF [Sphingosinicella terrae]|jgi:flagellar basal-body rod protein FlgF|uniref:flagellar basal body rod protein FlgF n=1 Tax=Sphingosinicella terrae TaxID=2172047 RepID=UPI000E0CFF26|nr:flagellar basal body rod protein FlgF [Sphingosinicella terrae]